MSHDFTFYIVDVFAEERYAGNQLAVFRANPSTEEMQRLALEMHYSETTFITSEAARDGGYDVRIFTPVNELPFAGHPTLGTAYIIRRELIGQPVAQVVLNLKVGQIPVTFGEDGVLWMRQKPPAFGHGYEAAQVAAVLGLSEIDIDTRFPIQEVSTGMPYIITPLKTLDAVKRAKVSVERFRQMIQGVQGLNADALLIFCPEVYQRGNHLNVRVFVDLHGIPEDPATGSANGCLAGYLARQRYFGTESVDVRVEQGYEIGRPSLLFLRSRDLGDDVEVNVGGRVQMIAQGRLVE